MDHLLRIRWVSFNTAFGAVHAASSDKGLFGLSLRAERDDFLDWLASQAPEAEITEDTDGVLDDTRRQLVEYFRGDRSEFELELDLDRLTGFQRRVLQHTARVPYGEVTTYGALARASGRGTRAARAVGGALGRNPIPVVIPCHRVIASDGSLGGFTGGLPRKRQLLALEQKGQEA